MEDRMGYPSVDEPHLENYPLGAREDVLSGIQMRAYDFLYDRVKGHLNYIALEYFGVKISCKVLLENIEKWAKAFWKYGIRKGDFVSVVLPNVPEMVYCFYALNRIGAIGNFIDPRLNADAILERVNSTKSKILIVIQDICVEKIDVIVAQITVSDIVIVSPASAFDVGDWNLTVKACMIKILYNLKKRPSKSPYVLAKDFLKKGMTVLEKYDCLFVSDTPISAIYTSGTTADAMNAGMFSNESYNSMVKAQSYGTDFARPGKRFLGVIPFFSAYGSFNGMHNSLCNIWTIIMFPTFKPDRFIDLIIKHKINAALGVPKFWEELMLYENKKINLSFLEIPVCGGDWISKDSVTRINRILKELNAKQNLKLGYGATEFGGAVATTSDENERYNPDSVGILLPGNSFMVIDPETEVELSYEQEGELCISGPTMMLEYFDAKEKTLAITLYKNNKKYYKTGDKAKITGRGEVVFCDRYKRVMILPNGHTVACVPIENMLISHPAVRNCATVGLKTSKSTSGVIPTAFVVLNQGYVDSAELAKELDIFCSAHIGERERALAIVFVEMLPYTLNGKIDFRKLECNVLDSMKYYLVNKVFFKTL